MFKLIILIGCLIGITLSGCPTGGCGKSSGSSGHSKGGCSSGCSGRSCGKSSSGGSSSGCSGGGCSGGNGGNGGSDGNGMMTVDYDIIPIPVPIGILDSPYYDCLTKSLFFVDLFGHNVYRYSEDTNQFYYMSIDKYSSPSFFIPARNTPNTYLMGVNTTVYSVQWDGFSPTGHVLGPVVTVEPNSGHYINNGIAGPKGGLYFGTFGPTLCAEPATQGLYRWTKNGGLETLPGKYVTSNSLGFDYKRNYLYHLDGCRQTLLRFKINPKTGRVSKPRIILSNFGLPNSIAPVGIAVKTNGHLVISSYKGGILHVVNPFTGEIIERIQMPTPYIVANTFGGCGMDKLFVLTASLDADITTGKPTDVIVPAPGGSLIVVHGLGKGQSVRKPCVGC